MGSTTENNCQTYLLKTTQTTMMSPVKTIKKEVGQLIPKSVFPPQSSQNFIITSERMSTQPKGPVVLQQKNNIVGRTESYNSLNHIRDIDHTGTSIAGSSNWIGIEERTNLKREEERLKTFNDWPVKQVDPSKLAAAGFYYVKSRGRDLVKCVFCGIEICDWRPNDDPIADHERWKSDCPFLKNESVGNIPISAKTDDNISEDSGIDTCGPYVNVNVLPNLCEKDDLTHPNFCENPNFLKTRPPSFPDYASIDARRKSFDSWPISLKLKPNVLSEAGFFYTGKGDQTICYHCGGGLKDWEETDEPWVEHARWFSKCPFVISLKGKAFIEAMCEKKTIIEDLKSTPLMNGTGFSSSTGELEKLPIITDVEKAEERKIEKEENEGSPSTSALCETPRVDATRTSDAFLCKICYAEERSAVFLPCGHMMACLACGISLSTCAVCRKPITAIFRTFIS